MADLAILAESPAHGADAVVLEWLILVPLLASAFVISVGSAVGLFWCGVRLARGPLVPGTTAGLLIVLGGTWLLIVVLVAVVQPLLACVHPAMLGIGVLWGRWVPPRSASTPPPPPPAPPPPP